MKKYCTFNMDNITGFWNGPIIIFKIGKSVSNTDVESCLVYWNGCQCDIVKQKNEVILVPDLTCEIVC